MKKIITLAGLWILVIPVLGAQAGQPAARVGDPTALGGTILPPGAPTVLIEGMPAARLGDQTVNPLVLPGPLPCVGGPIVTGSATVSIAGMPAATLGDLIVTQCGPPDTIINGAPTVQIGG